MCQVVFCILIYVHQLVPYPLVPVGVRNNQHGYNMVLLGFYHQILTFVVIDFKYLINSKPSVSYLHINGSFSLAFRPFLWIIANTVLHYVILFNPVCKHIYFPILNNFCCFQTI